MIGNVQTPQTLKKLIQISENAMQPLHVPIFLGNECFVVTQQDVRKVEDVRLLSYCKLLPNGQMIPMESLGRDLQAHEMVLQAFQQQQQQQQMMSNHYGADSPSLNLNQIVEFLTRLRGGTTTVPVYNATAGNTFQMPTANFGDMDVDDQMRMSNNAATIDQQLQWSQVQNSSAAYPLHCTSGTSTSELQKTGSGKWKVTAKQSNANLCSRGCNTSNNNINENNERKDVQVRFVANSQRSAREQAKDKKKSSTTEFSYIS